MTEPHPTRATPAIGSTLDQLDTPCLLLDLDIFERNVRHMSEYCRSHGVGWRPHAKCHKSRTMARQLTAAGAMGLTCAKLGEAEVMARAAVRGLLITTEVVAPAVSSITCTVPTPPLPLSTIFRYSSWPPVPTWNPKDW